MPNQQLIEHIRDLNEQGYPEMEIRDILLDEGYSVPEVDAALDKVFYENQSDQQRAEASDDQEKPQEEGAEHPGFIGSLTGVLLHPATFFQRIKGREDYKGPLVFLLLLGVIALAGQVVTQLVSSGGSLLGIMLLVGAMIAFVPTLLALILIAPFIISAIYHVICLVFGGSKSYQQTYLAVVYSMTPQILFQSLAKLPYLKRILIFNLQTGMGQFNLVSLWSTALLVLGLSQLQELDLAKAIVIVVLPAVIGLVVALIFFSQAIAFSLLLF